MQKKDPKSVLASATLYVAIIVFVVVYKSVTEAKPIRQTTLVLFIGAIVFLGYQWFQYFRDRKNKH